MKKLMLSFLLGVVSSLCLVFFIHMKGNNMKIIRTHEPLLISPDIEDISVSEGELENENCYVLPRGTRLYVDEYMPEGHVLYHAYFYHKGRIAHEIEPMLPQYQGNLIAPTWLYNIDSGGLARIFKRFPLSKKDVEAAVRANEMSRDDLVDIIRSLPE